MRKIRKTDRRYSCSIVSQIPANRIVGAFTPFLTIPQRADHRRSPGSNRRPLPYRYRSRFQLIADFVVAAEKAAEFLEEPDLNPEERSLLLTVITTPQALNRICRLVIVCDLTEDSERYFKGTFMGPEAEDILDSILPYLPIEIAKYWMGLQREDRDFFDSSMDRIFAQFRTSLRKVEIIEMTTGESISLWGNSKLRPAH